MTRLCLVVQSLFSPLFGIAILAEPSEAVKGRKIFLLEKMGKNFFLTLCVPFDCFRRLRCAAISRRKERNASAVKPSVTFGK